MAKADVLALAQILAADQADGAHLSRFYDDIIRELGEQTDTLASFSLLEADRGDGQYAIPPEAVRLLAVYYDDRELYRTDPNDLATVYGPHWRDRIERPTAFTEDQETSGAFRIVPAPDLDSLAFVPVYFSPFGLDYPGASGAMLHTDRRTDVPVYLELWLALEILAREFRRPSTHVDSTFAEAAEQLAMLVRTLVV